MENLKPLIKFLMLFFCLGVLLGTTGCLENPENAEDIEDIIEDIIEEPSILDPNPDTEGGESLVLRNSKTQTGSNGQQSIGSDAVYEDGDFEFPESFPVSGAGDIQNNRWLEVIVHTEYENFIDELPGGTWTPLINFYNAMTANSTGKFRVCYQYDSGSDRYWHETTTALDTTNESTGCGVIADDGLGRVLSLSQGDVLTVINVSQLNSAPIDLEITIDPL